MNFLLAVLSASAHSVNSISLRLYQTKFQKSIADLRLFQGLAMLIAAVCYWALNRFSFRLETTGVLLALCYGLDLVLTGITVSICYQCGPMSLTSVISNACVLQAKYPEARILVDASLTASMDPAMHEKVLDVLEGFQVKVINR